MNSLELNAFKDQYNWFEIYQEKNLARNIQELKTKFETIDQEIFNSSWRKSMGYIPDGFKSRTIITIFGPTTFRRRVYKYWDNEKKCYKYVFLADKQLQINKYSRISSHLKFKILERVGSGKRYRDIIDEFKDANISQMSISNMLNSIDLTDPIDIISNDIPKVKIPEYLYINTDETFPSLRKKKKIGKYRLRLVTFNTGYDKFKSTPKRKVLADKRSFFMLVKIGHKINTEEFMTQVEKMAHKFYSNFDDMIKIVGGDGATWIRKSTEFIPNSFYVLDKFHACRYLKRLFPTFKNEKNQEQYQLSKNFFEQGDLKGLINSLETANIKPEKNDKLKKIINYFKNNAEGVKNQSLKGNIGVSAEGDISHIVKWLLGYGSKAFNVKAFKNILLIRTAQINQLDVIAYLKNEYQKEHQAEKQFYWSSYWIRESHNDYEYPCQGEIPLTKGGMVKSKWIKNLIN